MTDSCLAVQTALYGYLRAETSLTSLLAAGANGVYDHVPPGAAFPYVVLGDMSARPFDTQGGGGSEVGAEIRVFSKGRGMKEAREIVNALYDALHNADFGVEGHALILCRVTATESALDKDGETRGGLLRLRLVTEPAS